MPNIFQWSAFTLVMLAPLMVLTAIIIAACKRKGLGWPRAILPQQLRLYLACLVIINCVAAWCFAHSGYDAVLSVETTNQFSARSLLFIASNLLLILICSMPLFYRLQALLFERKISLIQNQGIDRGLFLMLTNLLFIMLTFLLVPTVQYFLVHHGWLRGNGAALAGLFHIGCAGSIACLALAGISIAFARAPHAVRTMRTLRDQDLLPDYLAEKSDQELYPLMEVAQGLLKLNRAEALKAIEALALKPEGEEKSKIQVDRESN